MKALQGAVGVSIAVLVSTACSSVTAPASAACATSALTGTFGAQRNGQIRPGTLISAVGIATFDGKGNIVEHMTVMTNGTQSTVANQAIYAINADCTGTESDSSGNVVARLTVVHGGDEVLGMSAAPLSNEAMHYERITGTCSLASLNGEYGFQRNGVTSTGPLIAIGTVTFDGRGNYSASQITGRSGVFSTSTDQTGTYAVNPDCTSSESSAANGTFAQLAIVNGGDEVLGMSLTPGNNVVVHFERVK